MRILKDSMIYVVGELASKSIPFLLLPYLTRMLGPAGYGELAYYQVFISLAAVFIGLSQDGAVARYFYFYGKRSLGIVVVSGYIYAISISLPLIVIALIYNSQIMLFTVIAALTQSLLSVQLSIRQCQKKALSYLIIQLTNGLLSVILTLIIYNLFTASAENRIKAAIVANFIAVCLAAVSYSKSEHLRLRFSFVNYKAAFSYMFAFGLPLILHQLSFFTKGQLDRLIIYKFFSPTQLGVYAAGFQIASVFPILLLAINKAFVPFCYEGLRNGSIDFIRIKKWALLGLYLSPIPSIVAFVIPQSLFVLVLGADFESAKYYTCFFLLGLGLNIPYLILVNYFFYYGRNMLIAKCTLISAISYVILLFVTSYFDLKYVPLSLLLSNLVSISILSYMIKRVN